MGRIIHAVGIALVASLAFASLSRGAAAQVLPSYVTSSLDTALRAIYMNRADLAMRWDNVPDDVHRLSAIKRLFGDPLATFNVADSLAKLGLDGVEDPNAFFRYAGRLLDLGEMLADGTRPSLSDAEIRVFTKIDMNALDLTTALVLRRFLAVALTSDSRLMLARQDIPEDAYRRLVEFSDSLVLESQENAEATLVELKQAERYGMARAKQYFNIDAMLVDPSKMLRPGVALYSVSLDVARAMASELARTNDSIRSRTWTTPLGRIAIGGRGNDVYEGEYFCIIDVGGDDIYHLPSRTKADAADHATSLIVDFSGNDSYIGSDFSFGAALFGASTLIDLKGDDSYSVGNFGLGCGFFGVGVLYDGEGSDRYSGGQCVEGAGFFGVGLLVDAAGNDNYLAHFESQGFGYTRGIGGIVDRDGNDSYIATSPFIDFLRYDDHFETFTQGAALGYRPIASAGIGFIAEGAGNDIYHSDIFGQGTGYWYGLGALVDRKGSDSYNSFQYSQGAGVHLAFGVLIDDAGSDNYVSHGVSQGCGHDIGFGALFDRRGDDNYVVESLSQGGGNADAVSLFVDGAGDDGYVARVPNTMGFSDLRRMYGMVGVFLDLGGKDFYGSVKGANDSLWTGSFYGVGMDANNAPPMSEPSAAAEERSHTKEEIDAELATDLEGLFIQASAAPQKYQYIVEPARARLVQLADSSIPYLLSQLGSESARERLALGFILPRFGKRVTQPLIDTVRFGHRSRVGMAMYVLGEMKDTSAGVALGERLVDTTDWLVRSSAGEALLKMTAYSAKPYLRRALNDTFEIVRGRAARAFALVATVDELPIVLDMLDDTSQIVRYQIQLGLQQRGVDSFAQLFARTYAAETNDYARGIMQDLARSLSDPKARESLLDAMLESPSAHVRANGVRLALAWGDRASLRRAAKLKSREKNSMVLYEIYRVIDMERKARNGDSDAGTRSRRSRNQG
jgi:HEAT repeat protein